MVQLLWVRPGTGSTYAPPELPKIGVVCMRLQSCRRSVWSRRGRGVQNAILHVFLSPYYNFRMTGPTSDHQPNISLVSGRESIGNYFSEYIGTVARDI
jgi:hypothetical protein